MDQFDLYLQYQKEVAEATLKVISRFQKNAQQRPSKRTSKIDVARHVLKNAGRPMHVSEIIETAKHDFHVDLERDSIVSGIIKKVKSGKTFIRTAPNAFALKEHVSK